MNFLQSCLTFFGRFHVELWLCSSLFIFGCQKRKYFWLRYILATALFISLPYLLPRETGVSIYYWPYLRVGKWVNFSWILFYLLDMGLLAFLFRFNIKEVLFYGSGSYTMQHLLKRIIFLTCNIFSITIGSFTYNIIATSMLFPILFLYYWFFVRKIKSGERININNVFIIAISVTTVVLYCFLSSYDDVYSRGNLSLRITTCITDLLILTLLFGLFEQSKAAREKEEMTKMLHEKEEDMVFSRKNMELINMKAHDLKHQIEALKSVPEVEKNSYLKDLEKDVDLYDTMVKTKSEPLNLVLTKKFLFCQKHGIKFNYMVDDESLSFIDDVDLYSIMGNIIDNAIEALLKVKDHEKRIIYLTIRKKEGFTVIHEANYFEGELQFVDGLPKTSKDNEDYHGIGLRSVRYLTNKYHGNLTLASENNMFNLDILIPNKSK